MPATEIEERLARLEEKMAKIEQEREASASQEPPWWEQIIGIFKDDPHFDEAARLGREWRQSEKAEDDEDEAVSA